MEETFDGNLCRCTGYRPILDAAQSFSPRKDCPNQAQQKDACCRKDANGNMPNGCCKSGGCGVDEVRNGVSNMRFAQPHFPKHKADTELIFPPLLTKHQFKPLAFGNKRKKWFRPVTLQQLLEIKHLYPSAKIVGGSTETQIEIKFKGMQYKASVFVGDIPELRQYTFHDQCLEIGGNVVLTDLEIIVKKAVENYGPIKGQPFAAIHKQLRYFAGRQIKNVGTPAGNLATASPISDLNPVFVASNATLVARSLRKETQIPMSKFFMGYRTTALDPDAVIVSIRIPVAREKGEFFRAYKQAKRKDDDIAIVNAALRVCLDDSHHVQEADLVYGGMAPMTVSAKETVRYLQGKDWKDTATLEGAMNALEGDFGLRFGVPGGMATYRKSLAFGFFYRFFFDVLANINGEQGPNEDIVSEIERAISTGEKDHSSTEAYQKRVVGKANTHLSALKQCTGEAQYTDDIPPQKNELYGCLVLSTKAHARILNVDYAPAMELPGVTDWVDHTDLPSPEANKWGAPVRDEVFFAVGEVHTAGQPIGMILADSPTHATAGARAVKIDYEDLPAIFTIEEAVANDSYFDHFRYIRKGDVDAAFAKADHVFSGVSRIGGQEHFYLETQACVVIPKPEDGEIEVYSSTQNPTET